MNIIIVGATGVNGRSIINGLLASPTQFQVAALTRRSSLEEARTQVLRDLGVTIVPGDLSDSEDELVATLKGYDVVISTVTPAALMQQIPLANAAKKAAVKRFIPCSFMTAAPPRGVMALSTLKDDILNHIKAIHLPWTVVDVGFWYQIIGPGLSSGRLDSTGNIFNNEIFGGGSVPIAITHTSDIGVFVARIITDETTLNRRVFAYGAVKTQNEIFNVLEQLSGEKVERKFVSNKEIEQRINEARQAHEAVPDDLAKVYHLWSSEYYRSWGVRGDNTPENAKLFEYLDARELYPDIQPTTYEDYMEAVLGGKEDKFAVGYT